jgi:hypothetical protein
MSEQEAIAMNRLEHMHIYYAERDHVENSLFEDGRAIDCRIHIASNFDDVIGQPLVFEENVLLVGAILTDDDLDYHIDLRDVSRGRFKLSKFLLMTIATQARDAASYPIIGIDLV